MTIAIGFAISEASKEEMYEVFQVLAAAYAKDEVWVHIFKDCNAEEIHPWLMANMNPRWTMPDMKTFKVTELSTGENHGWDPEEDYHRKGTMVHPDYQNKGFGTELTKHCNAISDKSGGRTWVPARPTSVKMFRKNGFKDIGFVDAHLERWGGPRDKSITWTLCRNASSS
ncbi:uncharacterized protein RCO7_00790 [Rhynchosporium graminicola]|uniref:N-acetyltransferase domain-containing protein n=1 Tax=Rhynchosporium graminicola TaxID=2792576 RepID=A0A1E1K2G6_9HELO|nr:uncharacterized protein RCO7_00790 [Rhynchosporium commune]